MKVLPTIIPINELKNTANISKFCKESDGPIIITKNGYSDLVIMSVEFFENTMAKIRVAELVNEALDAPNRYDEKTELNDFLDELTKK